jgi:DNA gyrase subunit A
MLLTPQGGKPVASSPLRVADSAALTAVVATRTDGALLLFSEQGQVYRATLSDHQVSRSGAGRPIVQPGHDRIVAAFAGPDAPFYLLVTAGGQIKRLPAKTVENAHADGIVCCRVPQGDGIVAVVPHAEDDQILIAKAQGKILRMETATKLRAVPTGAAGTVAGTTLDPGDRVVAAAKAEGTSLLSIHESGMALAVALDEYPIKGRATAGVQSVLTDKPTKDPAGDLALIICQSPEITATAFTTRGSLLPINEADNPLLHRATNSRPFLALGPGDTPNGLVTGPPPP